VTDYNCPNWLLFLEESMPSVDDRERLRGFIRTALEGTATKVGKALVLVGPGGSGKSLCLQVISALFPKKDVIGISPDSLEKSETTRAILADGVRLNVVDELQSVETNGVFSNILVGESVSARHRYKKPFAFRPRAAHVFAVESLSKNRIANRRFIAIRFTTAVAVNTRQIVLTEVDAIRAWALAAPQAPARDAAPSTREEAAEENGTAPMESWARFIERLLPKTEDREHFRRLLWQQLSEVLNGPTDEVTLRLKRGADGGPVAFLPRSLFDPGDEVVIRKVTR